MGAANPIIDLHEFVIEEIICSALGGMLLYYLNVGDTNATTYGHPNLVPLFDVIAIIIILVPALRRMLAAIEK